MFYTPMDTEKNSISITVDFSNILSFRKVIRLNYKRFDLFYVRRLNS